MSSETPAEGVWSHAQWAERVNAGLEKTVVFVPEDTVPIGINGVIYYVERGKEVELPEPFFMLYQQSRKAQGEIMVNARGSLEKRSFGPNQTSITSGWNGNAVNE